jgi:twitching motility protein PilT
VAVFELLIATPAVRNLIADPANRYDLIPNEIATGGSHGMISFDQSLQDLVRRKIVDPAEASKAAVNPAPFKARP